MIKYQDVVLDPQGNVVSGASVTIYNTGTLVKPTIYSDEGVTESANPLTSSATGSFSFYVADGDYDIVITKAGFTTVTRADTTIGVKASTVSLVDAAGKYTGTNVETALTELKTTAELAASTGAALIGNAPAGNIVGATVQAAINELDTEKASLAQLAATGGAALVGIADAGSKFTGGTVEAALQEARTSAELSASTGAALVGFAPTGTVAAATVQAAIAELDTEKAALADLASTASGQGADRVANAVRRFATISAMSAMPASAIAVDAFVEEEGRGGNFYYVPGSVQAVDSVLVFSGNSGRWFREGWTVLGFSGGQINAKWGGAKGDGVTDDYAAINLGLAVVRASKGKLYFPRSSGDYLHSGFLYFGASDVAIEGENPAVRLRYTGTGTGLSINSSGADPQRERCALRNITLYSTTGAIAFDWTGGNYGNYSGFEINYTAVSAKLLYAIGSLGAGPYYNHFSGYSLIGGSDRSQTGVWMDRDTSGNLGDGPNANIFSGLKRAASLNRLCNLRSGTGNMFSDIGGESIKDALVVLNDLPSFSETGTATARGNYTLTDSTKAWSAVVGDPTNWVNAAVKITSGVASGTVRRIVSNTATVLTVDKAWPQDIGTPTYAIMISRAVANKFINVRQEGLATDNPDGIRVMQGARGNEFRQLEIGSLGTGLLVEDQSGDPSNKVVHGELIVERFVVLNPGPTASISPVPRLSVFGGVRSGSQMALEYIELASADHTTGVATLTVDHGGSATGNGSETLTAVIDATINTKESFRPSTQKTLRSTTNNGIFINLATDASVSATADYIITVAYRAA